MRRSPAPIEELKQKLKSPTPAVREVALIHAEAHGDKGVALAADVALLIDDEHPGVQFQAMHTFRAIGAGAADAVPVLLSLRAKPSASEMLVTRATFLLGIVGAPGALPAVPVLKADLSTPKLYRDALETLFTLAPGDPDVVAALIEAAFSSDYELSSLARDKAPDAAPELVDRFVDAIITHANGSLPEARKGAIILTSRLAAVRPKPLLPIILQALSRLGTEEPWPAVHAASQLPKPVPDEVRTALVAVAMSTDPAAERAVEELAKFHEWRTILQPVFLEVIRQNLEAKPVNGPEGGPARSFASAAAGLDAAAGETVTLLLQWLSRSLEKLGPHFSWGTVGKVLAQLARLDPESDEVHTAIRDAADVAFSVRDHDESSVSDFESTLWRIVASLPDVGLAEDLEDKGFDFESEEPREEMDGDDEEPPPPPLPEFPPETGPPPRATARGLTPDEQAQLAEAIETGRALAGTLPTTDPRAAAQSIEKLVRSQRALAKHGEELVFAVGALFGDAIVRATGWSWVTYAFKGREALAVVSSNRSHAHLPLDFIESQLAGSRDPAVLLLFNMLAAGSLPPAREGGLSTLG